MIDQTEADSVTAPTPLESILDGGVADVPASPQESEASSEDSGDEMVPLAALKRVRERHKRDAARVRELEQEIEKYNLEKWDLADEEPSQSHSQPDQDDHH